MDGMLIRRLVLGGRGGPEVDFRMVSYLLICVQRLKGSAEREICVVVSLPGVSSPTALPS